MSSTEPLRLTGDAHTDIRELRHWLVAEDDQRLLIETSGSSGTPKGVLLSRSAVLASAGASARAIGHGQWVLALPSNYVAGVNVIARSLLAGHDPVVADGLHWKPGARYISLVSTQMRRLVDDRTVGSELHEMDTVLVGGGPVDREAAEVVAGWGPDVVATYGSSETCGGCVYDGYPLPGVEVALTDDGRIKLRGPMLFDGYLDDPDLTAATLVDGWYLTSDLGTVADDGRLTVLGRIDDMVISGGVKVPGPVVARRLAEHTAIAAAEVVGVADPEWGEAVVAVVATPGLASMPAMRLDEARDWVASVHPRTWAPRRLVVVEELPLLANGKVDRQAVRALAEAAS
jgi:O-succinylbenzoic acid--CoA ligase